MKKKNSYQVWVYSIVVWYNMRVYSKIISIIINHIQVHNNLIIIWAKFTEYWQPLSVKVINLCFTVLYYEKNFL
jgi:hypothetical protein